MSLEETKKELEAELALALEAEKEAEKPEPEIKDEPKEEVKEEPKEEPKPEPKEEKAEEDIGPARLRRQAAAAEKKAAELEAKLRELEEKFEARTEEPSEETPLPPALREIIEDHTITRAERELQSFEARARANNPEYDAVANAYTSKVFDSIMTLNPDKSPEQVFEMTKRQILQTASAYLNQGFANPAEEMFHRAKEMGIKAPVKEEPAAKEELKPDMAKVAANRARSAGMAAASGESKGQMTKQAAADLTAAEWMKLPAEERRRLMYG